MDRLEYVQKTTTDVEVFVVCCSVSVKGNVYIIRCKCVRHWTGGSFLLKRHIYQNTAGKVFMCLGFQTYAALGIPLQKILVDGKDGFQ